MFSLQGRDTRSDFLAYIGLSIAFVFLGAIIVFGLSSIFGPATLEPDAGPSVLAGIALVLLVVSVTVIRILSTCRRFRDIDSSPWLALLMLIPVVNAITTIALMFIPSARGHSPEDAARVF